MSQAIPEWEQLDIPEIDDAEPEDANVDHTWNGEHNDG